MRKKIDIIYYVRMAKWTSAVASSPNDKLLMANWANLAHGRNPNDSIHSRCGPHLRNAVDMLVTVP